MADDEAAAAAAAAHSDTCIQEQKSWASRALEDTATGSADEVDTPATPATPARAETASSLRVRHQQLLRPCSTILLACGHDREEPKHSLPDAVTRHACQPRLKNTGVVCCMEEQASHGVPCHSSSGPAACLASDRASCWWWGFSLTCRACLQAREVEESELLDADEEYIDDWLWGRPSKARPETLECKPCPHAPHGSIDVLSFSDLVKLSCSRKGPSKVHSKNDESLLQAR